MNQAGTAVMIERRDILPVYGVTLTAVFATSVSQCIFLPNPFTMHYNNLGGKIGALISFLATMSVSY